MRQAVIVMIALLTFPGCVLAPPFYWAEEIHGRVVDADTGAPIEGAVIMANWKLAAGGYGHGGSFHSIVIEETRTDSKGGFSFGKWGPTMRPAYQALDYAPEIVIFKRGYDYDVCENQIFSNSSVRRSECSDREFRLKQFRGDATNRLRTLNSVLMVSALQPQLLQELLAEKDMYRTWPPEGVLFFEHVSRLLNNDMGRS